MTGRQPVSPVDAMFATYGKDKTESYEQHLDSLTILKNELHDIARGNDETSKDKRQERTCVNRKQTHICPGDYVCMDSLDLRYKGLFQVVDCRGHDIKIVTDTEYMFTIYHRSLSYGLLTLSKIDIFYILKR